MSQPALATNTPPQVLDLLRALHESRGEEIDAWLDARRMEERAPIYSSVDLRHAGYKIAPVDTNLFPAGFNNLSPAARARAAARIRARLDQYGRTTRRVLVIPENHTRNAFYIDNLLALKSILETAGCDVRVGSLIATPDTPLDVPGTDGTLLRETALLREGSLLKTADGFCPELILLNNDLTSGFPDVLRGVRQPIVPRPQLGWHRRRKSIHFEAYDKLAREFAETFDTDPWLISAEFHKCGLVDFSAKAGLECIAMGVERVLHRVRGHYARYGIDEKPYVYVKSDSGTYGMGIMTVHSGEELFEINKKIRNKMSTIKEGVASTEVIIQEGVPTVDAREGAPAEPMMYLVDGYAVGGAYRVNAQRDREGNLNAQGMIFAGMCDEDEPRTEAQVTVARCQFGALGLVAGLASLAATREEYGEGYSI